MQAIPFNRPYIAGTELQLMTNAMERGHISGDGHHTKSASRLLAAITGVDAPLLTTSCTHALEMTAILLNLQPGDEVIMPSFTFVSTANAYVLCGARPVFVDIKPGTNNLDEALIEQAITSKTKAIVVVHYAGVACEMDSILGIAKRHGIVVIEDNAHGLGATYKGRRLGTLGAMSTLSFHETKNIQCGEGGALLVADPDLHERAEILREKGTNRSRFFRGQVDKYTWVDIGSSYLLSDLQAAFLAAQLTEFDNIQSLRMAVWNSYFDSLSAWAQRCGFELPQLPADTQHPAHLFWILAPDLPTRTRFIAHMATAGVQTVFHYVPLHSSPHGRTFAGDLQLPITDSVSDRLIRLPLFAGLSDGELSRVIEQAVAFC